MELSNGLELEKVFPPVCSIDQSKKEGILTARKIPMSLTQLQQAHEGILPAVTQFQSLICKYCRQENCPFNSSYYFWHPQVRDPLMDLVFTSWPGVEKKVNMFFDPQTTKPIIKKSYVGIELLFQLRKATITCFPSQRIVMVNGQSRRLFSLDQLLGLIQQFS